jgi:SNF family Na+-dependent transporter
MGTNQQQYQPPQQPYVAAPVVGGVVGQPQQVVFVQQTETYTGHLVLALVTLFCCCCCLGIPATILAVFASQNAATNPQSAKQYARQSKILSIVGIVIGSILVVLLIVYYVVIIAVVTTSTLDQISAMNVTAHHHSSRGSY